MLTLNKPARWGDSLISLREEFDLLSTIARLVLSFPAGVAEFERALSRERIQAGLRRARAQGKRLGRPPRVYHRDRVLPLRQAGKSIRAIAQELEISRPAVQRALKGGAKSSC